MGCEMTNPATKTAREYDQAESDWDQAEFDRDLGMAKERVENNGRWSWVDDAKWVKKDGKTK
jgi:hypothetical protein